jgi:hypothetical protein
VGRADSGVVGGVIGRAGGFVPRVIAALRMTLVAVGLAAACSPQSIESGPLHVTTAPSGPDTRLTLHAAPHLKINARLAPALELDDGTLLRFRTGLRTADSAYYAEPPSAVLPGRHARVHGTLRASVCRDDEQVCRAVRVEI